MRNIKLLQDCRRVGFLEVMRELAGLAGMLLFLFGLVFGLVWLESI